MSITLGCRALSHPQITHITEPVNGSNDGPNRAERRARRFLTLPQIRERYEVSEKTPTNWVRRGYVTLYKNADGTLLLDVDEVDAALKFYGPTKMRDGRRRYGQAIKAVPVEGVEL